MLDDSSQAVDLSGFYFNALAESGLGPLSDEILMHLDNWSRQLDRTFHLEQCVGVQSCRA